MREVGPAEAKARLHGGGEIAFLDVREAGEFGEGHPLFAVPCPYSRLELTVPALVPNRAAPVLLIDGGDGVAERSARRLEDFGYSDVAIVAGGVPAWAAAGPNLFKGVNVPSKTLGELAEAVWHPATIDAATLSAWRREGRSFRLFDARPPTEFAKMHVPGAVCLPNGELAHRYDVAVSEPDAPVVVTCAGRTRGLIGAIGLSLAGIEGPIFALENGTQGWALAGETLVRGALADPYPELDTEAKERSRERARRFSEMWRIPWIDAAKLEALQANPERTLYLFDVRSAEEYAAGHLAGAVHAPGGQLVQATDQWIGVRRARVMLSDDTGLRAALAAFWLRQLGFEASVLADAAQSPPPLRGRAREGGNPGVQPPTRSPLPLITPQETAAGLARGTHHVVDLRSSEAHRAGHPVGAEWSIRPRLAAALCCWTTESPEGVTSPLRGGRSSRSGAGANFGRGFATPRPSPPPETGRAPLAGFDLPRGRLNTGSIVLLADEPVLAELAAIDLRELGVAEIFLLDGGMDAWREAGLPVAISPDRPSPDEAIDFLRFVHDRHDGNLEASRQYLAWEQGLVAQLDAEDRAEFRLQRPATTRRE